MHLLPFLESQLSPTVEIIDAVWDTCIGNTSLKTQTRAKRGGTTRRRTKVASNIPIPKGSAWQKFLPDRSDKQQLFELS